MEPDYQRDILRRLRELNALISSHIEKTKKDVKQLEKKVIETEATPWGSLRADDAGVRQLARKWQEQPN